MRDLSALSQLRGNVLWCYYDQVLNDFNRQIELSRARHDVEADDKICCICRPLSMKKQPIKKKGSIMKPSERIDEFVKKIENTPFFKQFRQEEEAETLKTRQLAVEKINTLEQQQSETLPKLRKTLEDREKKLKSAQQALEAAESEHRKAKAETWGKSQQFEYQIGQQRTLLIETAPPEIDDAIEFFQQKLNWLRQPFRISHRAEGSVLNLVTLGRITNKSSNLLAINAALTFCQGAIRTLELMKLEPVFDGDSIEELKAGVPAIDVFSEISGERPPKKIPVDNSINHLLKKARRVAGSYA